MHQAAVADRGEHRGQGEVEAERASLEPDFADGDGLARTESHFFEGAAVLAESDFTLGAAV